MKNSDPRMPNFFLVGAQKAATSSIHMTLQRHPDIFLPTLKEPMFFVAGSRDPSPEGAVLVPGAVADLAGYLELFSGSEGRKARGESSTAYLARWRVAIPRIAELVPAAKIMICLREPVSRAYSAYFMAACVGDDTRTFREAVEQEISRGGADLPVRQRYLENSSYDASVAGYLGAFGRDRVHVFLFEQLMRDPNATYQAIHRFLGVDEVVPPYLYRANVGGKYRAIADANGVSVPVLDDETRRLAWDYLSGSVDRLWKMGLFPAEDKWS